MVRVTPVVLPAVTRAVATPPARAAVRPLAQAVRPVRPVLLPRPEVLPYGGANLWIPFAGGIGLISLGIVLRRLGTTS